MSTPGRVATLLVLLGAVAAGLLGFVWLGGAAGSAVERAMEESSGRRRVVPVAGPGLAASPASAESSKEGGVPIPPPVDLAKVDRDLDLHGVVVTKEGTPVAGASLVTVTYPTRRARLVDYEGRNVAVEGPRTRSAKDGTFAMRLRRGDAVALRVVAAGCADLELPYCAAGQRMRIVLTPGVVLVVALKAEAGAPVPATPVRVFRAAHHGDFAFERVETTDAEGRARFAGLPGDVSAYVEPKPTRLGGISWTNVDLPARGETSVEIVLLVGRPVRGRVTDTETGAPIAGARVGINWTLSRAVSTDADGRYEMPGWHEKQGASDLHVLARGFGRKSEVVADRETVDFVLSAADTVAGRVVDAEGRPIAEAVVGAVPIGPMAGRGGDIGGTTRSEKDGRFRLGDLRHDEDHGIVFLARGFGRIVLDVPPHPGSAGTIDLGDVALPAARAIEGRVLDAEGLVLARVSVGVTGANADRGRLRPAAAAQERDSGYGTSEETFSDDLGRFRFPDLSAGSYVLSARPPGRPGVTKAVSLGPDADVRDADLSIESGRPVRIRVRDAEGDPVRSAFVNVVASENGSRRVSAQTDGRGVVDVFLGPGEWHARVHWIADLDPKKRRFLEVPGRLVPADAESMEFVLEQAAPISGFTRGADGKPVAGAYVQAVREGETCSSTLSDASGTFTVQVPVGSRVDLLVDTSLKQVSSVAYTNEPWSGETRGVKAGAEGVVVVLRRPQRDRTIVVRAFAPDGTALGGARVSAHSRESDDSTTTDLSGVASLDGLSSAAHVVTALPDDAHRDSWLEASIDNVEPAGQTIVLRLRQGAMLAGVVVGPDGSPVPRAYVAVRRNGARLRNVHTDEDGGFRIPVEPDGSEFPLSLWVHASLRGEQLEGTVSVAALGDTTIRLSVIPR